MSENEGAFPVSVLQRVNSFLVGNKTPADSYALVRLWLVRGLGFVYFVACSILFFQGVALWGKDGLLPIGSFADAVVDNFGGRGAAFWRLPSLFYFGHSDGLIWGLGLAGMVLAAVLMAGYANVFMLLALWLVQLSFVNSGQLFYGYGWETQLLELTFLTCFLVPVFDPRLKRATAPPPRIVIWALRWMLFRLMLGAGLIKIRNDSCWRDLTCLIYHYETQPIPNPLSFFYHHMPPTFHYAGCLFNHFVELVVPFGYFGPAVVRRWAGLITIVFQCILISSGNLAWLNWVTLVMCIPCFDDAFLTRRLGKRFTFEAPPWKFSPVKTVVLSCFTAAVAWLSISPALNLVDAEQAMNTSYSQWHLVNSYGAFGSVGRERYDVVIEATDEPEITEHTRVASLRVQGRPGGRDATPAAHHAVPLSPRLADLVFGHAAPHTGGVAVAAGRAAVGERPADHGPVSIGPFSGQAADVHQDGPVSIPLRRLEGLAQAVVDPRMDRRVHAADLARASAGTAAAEETGLNHPYAIAQYEPPAFMP